MATTKITSDNITDGAITSAKLASGVGGVAGIVSSADATAITIGSDESVTFANVGTFGGTVTALTNFNSTSGNDLRLNAGSANRDIFMQVNGTTHMTVQGSTGNVSIGTDSPSGKLSIQGTTATSEASHITFENTSGAKKFAIGGGKSGVTNNGFSIINVTDNTAPFNVSDAGNVGIGVTPTQNFNLQSAGAVEARFHSTDSSCSLQISSDADEGQNSELVFMSGTTGRGSILFAHHPTAASQAMLFKIGDNAVESMRLDGVGSLRLGTNTTTGYYGEKLTVTNSASYTQTSVRTGTGSEGHIAFNNANGICGTIFTNGSATSYNVSSDYRLKENVVTDWDATTRLKQLKPSRFNFIVDADKTVDGFLAHEVQDIVPEAISGTKDAMQDEEYEVTPAVLDDDGNVVTEAVMGTRSVPDYQGIDQSKLVPLLVKTIQELEARITTLENA